MKFVYTADKADTVIEHEKNMLKGYLNIITNYSDTFAQYGCSLDVGLFWINSFKNIKSDSRLPFCNGYECYIYCNVMKNGKILRYSADDGEVEYYEAAVSWNISSVYRCLFHLTATLNSETDGINDEVMYLLKAAQEYK